MPSFTYKAVDGSGVAETGVLTAENYEVALRQLEEKALFPIKVTEGADQGVLAFGKKKKVKTHHLTAFYSQLADLLKAGVPMLRSLDVLSRQDSYGSLTQVLREVREEVAGGTSLGDAMAKHPHAFSSLHSSMVRAGEHGGFLEEALARIAGFSEKQDELRNKVVGAMIYPAILVFVGSGVILLVMLVVVPKIREHLREENFNALTVIVFWLCDVLQQRYMAVLLAGGLTVFGIGGLLKTEWGKAHWEQLKLRMPLFGQIFTMVSICRFCRILGTMLRNGVPILQALKISKDSAGNQVLAALIDEARDSVKKGAALSDPLGASGLFPPAVVDMISVAEESNNLETVLVQIADTNEVRTARQIEIAVKILEPVLLVLMASVVFCILVAILLPILTMGSAIDL